MKGSLHNVGGGPAFTRSILGMLHHLKRALGVGVACEHADWRPGDQPVYVGDIRKAAAELGWRPRIDPETGVARVLAWVCRHQNLIREQLGDLPGIPGAPREAPALGAVGRSFHLSVPVLCTLLFIDTCHYALLDYMRFLTKLLYAIVCGRITGMFLCPL